MRTPAVLAALAVLAVAVLAAPALAEGDAETRFHDAYLLEVVEGKVAAAAKIYFELAESEETPEKVRREAAFRFAVTCVLLGRADEARARFAGMLADPDLPEGLRARVTEYRKAVEGIGIGTELDKKLESLVFELGRAPISGPGNSYLSPDVYRDFLIIGKPAVPLLKKLLAHPDNTLRQHAFRLLTLMDEPGMVEIWEPERHTSGSLARDLGAYAEDDPALWRRVEEKLLESDAEVHPVSRFYLSYNRFSTGFARELAKREGQAKLAFEIAKRGGLDDSRIALMSEWLASEDPELSLLVATYVTEVHKRGLKEYLAGEDVFRRVTRRLSGERLGWSGDYRSNYSRQGAADERGYYPLARSMPVAVLLETLASEIGKGETVGEDLLANPIKAGLTGRLADAIDTKELTDVQAREYLDLLERWLTVATSPDWTEKTKVGKLRQGTSLGQGFGKHLLHGLRGLSTEDAVRRATGIVERWPGHGAQWFRQYACRTPGDVRVVTAAIRAAPAGFRKDMLRALPYFGNFPIPRLPPEVAAAQAKVMPEILPLLAGPEEEKDAAARLESFSAWIPVDTAKDLMMRFAELGKDLPEGQASNYLRSLLQSGKRSGQPYVRDVVVPMLPTVWSAAGPGMRLALPAEAMNLLLSDQRYGWKLGEARGALASFIREHLTELPPGYLQNLAGYPDLFPPEEWVARVSEDVWSNGNLTRRLKGEAGDRAAEILVGEGSSANASVVRFVIAVAGKELQGELCDRMLENGDAETVARVARWLMFSRGKFEISPESAQKAVDRGLAAGEPDLRTLSSIGTYILLEHPTEELFPLVRKLLAAEDVEILRTGIRLAKALGREEMIPHLIDKLDSMVSGLRTEAKGAIDAILEVKRSREEAERRFKAPEKTE